MLPRVLLILVIFIGSCLVGPMLDQIHVVGGALSYANPWLFDQAWWVGPQFGLAFAGLAAGVLMLQERFGAENPPLTGPVRAGQQFAWFIAAYAATGMFWRHPVELTIGLSLALVVRFAYDRPDRATIQTIVLLAIAGTTYEALLASIPGTFSYTLTHGVPAPIWLPLLYAHGAPVVRTFMKNATVLLPARRA